MNTLARWNPLKDVDEMHNRLMNVLLPHSNGSDASISPAAWSPSVDIIEDDGGYTITAELPEVKKEDVKVTLENGVLTLTGERKLEKEENGRKYHRIERSYGSFLRSFTLPENADPSGVEARFSDGLLKVHVRKSEQARPNRSRSKSIDLLPR